MFVQTPAGPRRIIVRSIEISSSASIRVMGIIYDEMHGQAAEFTSHLGLEQNKGIQHMCQQLEVAIAQAIAVRLGLAAPTTGPEEGRGG